ncbi:flavin reductase family protein [Nonomuraea rubra]|uniref:Flavin reductase (DIM6/NTAB) family NADH-FMN oxidoreductase RutF n=1 Tax=Nonomuraea rubra TaxID=46180 RepID=A0A7X0NPK1_9ACTN|nr:flavin reductase family protein [Nonomuraea rubra]MBB6547268.1 flavin reductase (DIM6/NTAB) family NADH-FMN oxidoreductase RutF [Nonomuraea rubra]
MKIQPAVQELDGGEFRTFMSSFPTGVAVVTTLDAAGKPLGFTCSSLCSLSLAPPLLLVCVNRASGTLGALRAHGAFAVNLLGESGRQVAEIFATPRSERFDAVPWHPTGPWSLPWLREHAHAVAECELREIHPGGDHVIVVGAVTGVRLGDGRATPLLRGLSRYSVWPG